MELYQLQQGGCVIQETKTLNPIEGSELGGSCYTRIVLYMRFYGKSARKGNKTRE